MVSAAFAQVLALPSILVGLVDQYPRQNDKHRMGQPARKYDGWNPDYEHDDGRKYAARQQD
tara:strand:+ start:1247 stop:1429 length:183 start_codon:yes stop_codon:yes gene_type:complete